MSWCGHAAPRSRPAAPRNFATSDGCPVPACVPVVQGFHFVARVYAATRPPGAPRDNGSQSQASRSARTARTHAPPRGLRAPDRSIWLVGAAPRTVVHRAPWARAEKASIRIVKRYTTRSTSERVLRAAIEG